MLTAWPNLAAALAPVASGAAVLVGVLRRLAGRPAPGLCAGAPPRAADLQAYRRWFRDLGRLLPALIVETDAARRIVLVNSGFPDGQHAAVGDRLEGSPVTDLVEGSQRAGFARLLDTAMGTLEPVQGTFDLAWSGLRACPVRVQAAPVVADRDGTAAGLRCVFTDISGELRSRAQLDHQRSAAAAITGILRTISSAAEGEMDDALARALVAVGGLATIDRCFLARFLEDGDAVRWDFCWAAEGVELVAADAMPSSLSMMPWLSERLVRGGVVHIEDVAAMPVAAGVEKVRLLRHEVRSALAIPLYDGGRVAGLLAFQSVRSPGRWHDEDVRLLETVGQILAGAWHRRRVGRERDAARRRLADTVAFLPDATFVLDEQGRVVAWNRALEELTGVPGDRLVGRGEGAHAAALYGETAPDLVDLILAGGAGCAPGYDYVESRGETLCAERFLPGLKHGRGAHVWVTASPLRDDGGRLAGAIESIKDITDRKLAEQARRRSEERVRLLNEDLERRVDAATAELRAANAALRESEARYRRIIDSLGDRHIFYSLDPQLRFTFVSSSYRRLMGVETIEDLDGRARQWLADPRNGAAARAVGRLLNGERQPPFDLVIRLPDRSERVLEIHSVPVASPQGAVLSLEGVARDVTDDRRNARLVATARERLLEAEKMAALGAMVAGVSHEMATPVGIGVTAASHLAALCGDGQRSLREGSLTRSGLEMLLQSMGQAAGAVQANLARAADLIQNFKQVAVDQSSVQVRDFDLAAYLDEIVLSLRPRFRDTGHRLAVDCPPGIVLHGDPGALYRVVANLVVNSLEHGFEGRDRGTIVLGARRGRGGVVLDYRDDGAGMTAEQRQRLYEPFYTTRRGRGGTGLGMHVVWTNVTQVLGGSIACTSAPGSGTRFTIVIPQHAEASHAQASGQ